MDKELIGLIENTLADFDDVVKNGTDLLHTDGDMWLLDDNKRDLARIRAWLDVKINIAYKAGKEKCYPHHSN